MLEHVSLWPYSIRSLPKDWPSEKVTLGDTPIALTRCKTGFGYRRYFVCPRCGKRRMKLYELWERVLCRCCLPVNIYERRCNAYDENAKELIILKMYKLADSVGIELRFPFYYSNFKRPRYMREAKWHKILKQLQMLENMRFSAILGRKRFTATDIKRYTSEEFTEQFEIWEIANRMLFCSFNECMAVIGED